MTQRDALFYTKIFITRVQRQGLDDQSHYEQKVSGATPGKAAFFFTFRV
jgi:hypothetical protein